MDYGNKPSAVITNESVDLTEEASAKAKPTAESSSSVKETKMGLEMKKVKTTEETISIREAGQEIVHELTHDAPNSG